MQKLLDILVSIFRQPAIFIGFVAFLGLVLQKKNISDILKGTFKTVIGMLILFKGVDIVINGINPLSNAFTKLFAIQGSAQLGDFGKFLGEYGSTVGLIMLLGLICNLLIARFTKFKTIYLTGNLLFWFPMLFLAVGLEAGLKGNVLIVFALIFHILVITIFPYMLRPHVKIVTGSDSFTIGHTASIFCLMGSYIGKFIGNKEKSTEDINLPRSLEFFRETTVTSGIVIFIIYIVVGLLIGSELRTEVFGKDLLFTYSLIQGMTFAAGMVVLLLGARMMLGEIIPAFKGIADKIVPGAVPALDIPMVFPYAPTALLIGFIVSLTTSIITIFVIGSLGILKFAIVPLTIACYFDVAPAAIFANARGGRTAAIVTSALGGVILMIFVSITIPMVSNTVGNFLQAYGGNEFSFWVLISRLIANIFS